MRPIARIKPFLDKVNIDHLFRKIFDFHLVTEEQTQFTIDLIKEKLPEIEVIWNSNPDWRFTQVLVNMGLLGNYPGVWYYYEEEDILIDQGHKPEDVYYWGTNFDKDMTPLPRTIWRPISELTSDHLRAIINNGFVSRNKTYRQIMLKVLRSRGERLIGNK